MPVVRKHSSKKKGKSNSYGHALRLFDIMTDTLSTIDKMMTWAGNHPWFDERLLYRQAAPNSRRRGPKKDKAGIRAAIVGECKTRQRREIKKNLIEFVGAATGVSSEEIHAWLTRNGRSFIPSIEELESWRTRGYAFGQIIELISSRNLGILEDLDFSAGKWQTILSIHDAIGRGELEWDNDEDDDSDDSALQIVQNNSNNNVNNNRKGRKRKRNQFENEENVTEPRNKKRKINHDEDNNNNNENSCSYNNNNNNNNNNKNKKNNNNNNKIINPYDKYKIKHIKRRENEGASNYHVKSRMENKHPYVRLAGDSQFMIQQLEPDDDEVQRIPVIEGSTGDAYIYDTRSVHFNYDKQLVKRFVLTPHSLKYLHKRMVAQHHVIQYGYINSRMTDKSIEPLRVNGGTEYRIGGIISEFLGLTFRISNEDVAFEFNKKLIENENDFRNDYKLGYNESVEGACRLPRSKEYMNAQKKQGKFKSGGTYWFVINNILTMKERLGDDKWEERKQLWDVFGVMGWIKQLLIAYFPGKEALAVELGLLKEEDADKVDILDNGGSKESIQDLEMFL